MTVVIPPIPPSSSPSPTAISCDSTAHDPPPPYPSRERRARTARSLRRHRLQTAQSQHTQHASTDSHSDHEASSSPQLLFVPVPFQDDHNEGEPTETTPFLAHSSPISTPRRLVGRPRSYSHTSTTSLAPSLGHTVLSLFRTDDESDYDEELEQRPLLAGDGRDDYVSDVSRRHHGGFFSKAAWGRYFRPLVQSVYYRSLFHLMVVNFPYALAAWVYLFVFTVVSFFISACSCILCAGATVPEIFFCLSIL
jgi:hypothetical protein